MTLVVACQLCIDNRIQQKLYNANFVVASMTNLVANDNYLHIIAK